MGAPPRLPSPIGKVPKAFASWARGYNQALAALQVLVNMDAGTGVSITWSERNVIIRNTAPDLPIYAGAGISVTTTGNTVTITNLNP